MQAGCCAFQWHKRDMTELEEDVDVGGGVSQGRVCCRTYIGAACHHVHVLKPLLEPLSGLLQAENLVCACGLTGI